MKEISDLTQIDYGVLRHRLQKGWTLEDALGIPVISFSTQSQIDEIKMLHQNGMSQRKIAAKLGIKAGRVWYALNKNNPKVFLKAADKYYMQVDER